MYFVKNVICFFRYIFIFFLFFDIFLIVEWIIAGSIKLRAFKFIVYYGIFYLNFVVVFCVGKDILYIFKLDF